MFKWFERKKDAAKGDSKQTMVSCGITPAFIEKLKDNEIFVFGSNLQGLHGAGAARTAREYFGAIMGCGVGLQGQSYAIPTMHGGIKKIKPYVDDFIEFAKEHTELHFLVTRIGCGIAGLEMKKLHHCLRKP